MIDGASETHNFKETHSFPEVSEIPEMILYCERCFSLGNCPPEARREQTTIDNPHASVLCGSCLREQGLEPLIVKLEGGN